MAAIVLAEDQEDIRWVVVRLLQRAGHAVVAAADGVEALDAVRHHRPDIVITDVGMPRMDGLQLCRAIRADPRLCDIPVMVISGALLPDDPAAAEAGVSAIVTKPFIPPDFLRQVDRLLAVGVRSADHLLDLP